MDRPGTPLETAEDIQLSFHSVSARQGHFGSSTVYVAAERRVVYRTWGAKRRCFGLLPPRPVPTVEQYLKIPPQIVTEEELWAYVKKHRSFWLHGSGPKREKRRSL